MRTDNLHIRGLKPLASLLALTGWALAGAIVFAIIAGVFGMLVGVVFGVLHSGMHSILPMAGYFALCGAAAGGLFAAFCRIVDPEGLADLVPQPAASAASRQGALLPRTSGANPSILQRLIGRSESQRISSQQDPSLN